MTLPESFPEERVNFYMYNPNADLVWIDDFRLKVFE